MSKNPFEGIKIQLNPPKRRKVNSSTPQTIFTGAFYKKFTRKPQETQNVSQNSFVRDNLNGNILEIIRRNQQKRQQQVKEDSVTHLPKHLFATPNASLFAKLNLEPPQKRGKRSREISIIPSNDFSIDESLALPDYSLDFQPGLVSTPKMMGTQANKVQINYDEKCQQIVKATNEAADVFSETFFPKGQVSEVVQLKKALRSALKIMNSETVSDLSISSTTITTLDETTGSMNARDLANVTFESVAPCDNAHDESLDFSRYLAKEIENQDKSYDSHYMEDDFLKPSTSKHHDHEENDFLNISNDDFLDSPSTPIKRKSFFVNSTDDLFKTP